MSVTAWFSRRAVLVNAARALLIAVGGSRFGVSLGWAQDPKPRLLSDDFNRRFASLRNSRQFAREMGEAKRDLAGYLTRYFELTPAQIETVKAFPAEDVRAVNAALDRAVTEGLTLKLSGVTKGNCGRTIRPRFSVNTLTIEMIAL